MDRKALRDSIERELYDNLLPFWRERSIDRERGGFVSMMDINGTLDQNAPRGLVLNARLLWTFSALYRGLGNERDLTLAHRARDCLETFFRDRENGGYVWQVDPDGNPLDCSKKIYGQAFCIYALSEYFEASGDNDALKAALDLRERLERDARDSIHGGYIEVLSADWSAAEDLRLSDKDMNVAKSMNNHLHILEAYTNLQRVYPDRSVAERLRELIGLFGSRMLSSYGHFDLFFDEDWTLRSDSYTYGHDIEAAWLLYDAARVLKDRERMESVSGWVIKIVQAVENEAVGADGGIAYEGRGGAVIDSGREWWPQAEAMLGFWAAFKLTGDERYARIMTRLWDFIQRKMVDRKNGEWFWRVFADGTVDRTEPKISEWKDPYHGIRMCLRMIKNLED